VVGSWNVGRVYHNCTPAKLLKRQNEDHTPVSVEALDGLLLATQADIPWREDLFDGWDFYDISQCFEMKRREYKVVIPYQEDMWCYHDSTYSKMGRYQEFCDKFVDEYQDIKPFYHVEYSEGRKEMETLREESRRQLIQLVNDGNQEEVQNIFRDNDNRGYLHLRPFEILADISRQEQEMGAPRFWRADDTWESLSRKLAVLRFGIKRLEYHADEGGVLHELQENFSRPAINVVSGFYIR
jgi:hypothetical protein